MKFLTKPVRSSLSCPALPLPFSISWLTAHIQSWIQTKCKRNWVGEELKIQYGWHPDCRMAMAPAGWLDGWLDGGRYQWLSHCWVGKAKGLINRFTHEVGVLVALLVLSDRGGRVDGTCVFNDIHMLSHFRREWRGWCMRMGIFWPYLHGPLNTHKLLHVCELLKFYPCIFISTHTYTHSLVWTHTKVPT